MLLVWKRKNVMDMYIYNSIYKTDVIFQHFCVGWYNHQVFQLNGTKKFSEDPNIDFFFIGNQAHWFLLVTKHMQIQYTYYRYSILTTDYIKREGSDEERSLEFYQILLKILAKFP